MSDNEFVQQDLNSFSNIPWNILPNSFQNLKWLSKNLQQVRALVPLAVQEEFITFPDALLLQAMGAVTSTQKN